MARVRSKRIREGRAVLSSWCDHFIVPVRAVERCASESLACCLKLFTPGLFQETRVRGSGKALGTVSLTDLQGSLVGSYSTLPGRTSVSS